jgi:hypothetical protein
LNFLFLLKVSNIWCLILLAVEIFHNIMRSVFSWKKEYIKKLRCNSTVKIQFGREKILNYAYVFFQFLHKACWILLFESFSGRIRQSFYFCHVPFLQQTISHMRKRFTELSYTVSIVVQYVSYTVSIVVQYVSYTVSSTLITIFTQSSYALHYYIHKA